MTQTKIKSYILVKRNSNTRSGFAPATSKNVFYDTIEEAKQQKEKLEALRQEQIFIMERKSEVIL